LAFLVEKAASGLYLAKILNASFAMAGFMASTSALLLTINTLS